MLINGLSQSEYECHHMVGLQVLASSTRWIYRRYGALLGLAGEELTKQSLLSRHLRSRWRSPKIDKTPQAHGICQVRTFVAQLWVLISLWVETGYAYCVEWFRVTGGQWLVTSGDSPLTGPCWGRELKACHNLWPTSAKLRKSWGITSASKCPWASRRDVSKKLFGFTRS